MIPFFLSNRLTFKVSRTQVLPCFRKMLRCLQSVCAVVTISSGIFLLWLNFLYRYVDTEGPKPRLKTGEKIVILAWTRFFNIIFSDEGYLAACHDLPCTISNDHLDLNKAAAVVFHVRDTSSDDLPKKRLLRQHFVFLSHEAPPYTYLSWPHFNNFFNWTMTYREDSDIPYPYSLIVQRNLSASELAKIDSEINTYIDSKSKSIVWFVSNCHTKSKRELIAEELSNYIEIDKFGKCGNHTTCSNKSDRKCVQNVINEQYRFHLAFENTICKDYITEKYWGRWQYYSIPMVLQRKIYQNFAPPDSFIAVDDYTSLKSLADHLQRLEQNRTEYEAYFDWRRTGYHGASRYENGNHVGFCGLCQKLIREETEWNSYYGRRPVQKSYSDFEKWWVTDSKCDSGEFARKYVNSIKP